MADPRAELRAAAEKATPGPWAETCMGSEGYHVHERHPADDARPKARRKRIALCTYEDWETDKANAAFIALSSPDVVLSLLDDLDNGGAEWSRMTGEHDALIGRVAAAEAEAAGLRAELAAAHDETKRLIGDIDYLLGTQSHLIANREDRMRETRDARAQLADARRTLDAVLGDLEKLRGDINHLVQPIIGAMRMDGANPTEQTVAHRVDRLYLVLALIDEAATGAVASQEQRARHGVGANHYPALAASRLSAPDTTEDPNVVESRILSHRSGATFAPSQPHRPRTPSSPVTETSEEKS